MIREWKGGKRGSGDFTGGKSSNDITASGIEPPKTCDNTTGYTVNTDPSSETVEESSFSFKD